MLGKVGLNKQQVSKALNVVDNLPQIDVKWSLESKSVEADGTGTVTIDLRRVNKERFHTCLLILDDYCSKCLL